jgi:HPt (histidine-containing phosphotransfer) domain-containing protein
MTSPTGLVDFFVLEASDYAERLDAAIATGGLRGPEPEALARYGRALRGTATMSRFPAIAQLAGAIERVGRAMHSGRLPWSPALAGAITSGVDEVKVLVRAAREWTPAHEERAAARTTELLEYVPAAAPASAPIAGNAAAYLGGEVAAISTGLMAYLTTGGNEGALALVLRRARAVLGVATVKDAPRSPTSSARWSARRRRSRHARRARAAPGRRPRPSCSPRPPWCCSAPPPTCAPGVRRTSPRPTWSASSAPAPAPTPAAPRRRSCRSASSSRVRRSRPSCAPLPTRR